MTSLIIFGTATVLYIIFHLWYYGLGRKISAEQVEQTITAMHNQGLSEVRCQNIRNFLEQDDGKDVVMVNLLDLKQPLKESRVKLKQYSEIFLGKLIKRAGHPVAQALAAGGMIEALNIPEDEYWRAAFLVRYRSRTDMAEVIVETIDSPHHNLKLEALEKTFAFPAAPWFILGGPKLIVPLTLALAASLLHIILV